MILNIYTIYDSAAKAYLRPFFLHNDAMAVRAFKTNVNDHVNSDIYKSPDQFTLFKIGTYNDETAELEMLSSNQSLGVGTQFKDLTQGQEPEGLQQVLEQLKYLSEQLDLAFPNSNRSSQ